jgi:hypothetical protein
MQNIAIPARCLGVVIPVHKEQHKYNFSHVRLPASNIQQNQNVLGSWSDVGSSKLNVESS